MQAKTTSGATPVPARERIMRKAHELFYRDGIRATGIDRIIAESGVTKVTFYRHFPSKNDLIQAYLEYRHALWMAWFVDALERHRSRRQPADVLLAALAEWFMSEGFRGCAFINAIAEFDGALPEAAAISRRHKSEMRQAIAGLLPPSARRDAEAQALAMAIDGAIVRAQMDESPNGALKTLAILLRSAGRGKA